MERLLVCNDPALDDFVDKNALEPLFTALADKCISDAGGVLTMINPTVALCAASALEKRRILAQRYHIHTVLTCHQPGQVNLSQSTGINESIIVAKRHDGPKPDTRFINLDRMPADDVEVDDLHQCLRECANGVIANGWGEVSHWPAEHIAAGDWTPAIWRSPELAAAAARFANDDNLVALPRAWQVGRELTQSFERGQAITPVSFPVIDSGGADGQQRIQSNPDSYWMPKMRDESIRLANGGTFPLTEKLLNKASNLLVTFKHNSSTARLTAVSGNDQYIGNAWMTIADVSETEAMALAVFLNATPGRLQIMSNPGQSLAYPQYPPAIYASIRIPDVRNDDRIRQILADCWERTKDTVVPQFRDGECAVRRLWDEAVAAALGWDAGELANLRRLLHQEPHVRGLGYNQYADEIADLSEPAPPSSLNRQFQRLVAEWNDATAGLSSPRAIAGHAAYQQIIALGPQALPLIFRDLKENGGWWYPALRALTGVNPVPESARGNLPLNDAAWLKWGQDNGYI